MQCPETGIRHTHRCIERAEARARPEGVALDDQGIRVFYAQRIVIGIGSGSLKTVAADERCGGNARSEAELDVERSGRRIRIGLEVVAADVQAAVVRQNANAALGVGLEAVSSYAPRRTLQKV